MRCRLGVKFDFKNLETGEIIKYEQFSKVFDDEQGYKIRCGLDGLYVVDDRYRDEDGYDYEIHGEIIIIK